MYIVKRNKAHELQKKSKIRSLYRHKYMLVFAKGRRNSLVYFTGIATVNNKPYNDILRRFRDAIRKQRPPNWTTNSWFHIHDDVPAHQSVSVKEQCDNTGSFPIPS